MQKSILNSEKITKIVAEIFARRLIMRPFFGNVVLFY